MIAFLIGLIIVVLLLGVFFKLLKIAIVVALVIGGLALAQKYLGKGEGPRLP